MLFMPLEKCYQMLFFNTSIHFLAFLLILVISRNSQVWERNKAKNPQQADTDDFST